MIERSRRFSTTAHALYALMADDDVVQNIMKKKTFYYVEVYSPRRHKHDRWKAMRQTRPTQLKTKNKQK